MVHDAVLLADHARAAAFPPTTVVGDAVSELIAGLGTVGVWVVGFQFGNSVSVDEKPSLNGLICEILLAFRESSACWKFDW
jgi:hypothetical protein